jgi:hypothetical protein
VDLNYLPVQPVELGGVSRPRLQLGHVYSVYTGQFRRWFGITAPTSVLASVVLLLANRKIHAIYSGIPLREIQYHWGEIGETYVLRFGAFFISWLLGCIALAAIATVVNGLDADDTNDVWRSDGYQKAREHFGALLLAAIGTFCAFLAGMAIIDLVVAALVRAVGWSHFSRFNFVVVLISYVFIASIVSWFGMAIPLVLSGDAGAWIAFKKSFRLSNGYEALLFLLVVESVVGSYLAWYAVRYGLTVLFPAQLRYTEWYGWVVYFVAILASAAVEPPMFIGFSLLASQPSLPPIPIPEFDFRNGS